MYVDTDDAARRTEYRYLGPTGVTFPFAGRPWALGLGVALTIVLGFIWFMATPFLDYVGLPGPLSVLLHIATSALAGVVGAAILVRIIGKEINPVTPLRHHISVRLSELDVPRPDTSPRTYSTTYNPETFIENNGAFRQVTTCTVPAFITVHDDPTAAADYDDPTFN